ncbi:VOC family protein [Nocardioides jiangxiensis]|uniref:VOC family protein n=1 Tax=Nocardioides jiangxiensis TaxID=3064524 RepID=A0ABT9AXZ5_9ACTN|nr:VOC family protein [Nocardioides sp. WY-20]MDO7866925.1 VOC family protein [Nocardioides sp. WY-20]
MKIQNTFLTVDDHDKALEFYVERLGFVTTNDVAFGDFRWVSIAAPDDLGTNVVLINVGGGPDTSPSDREALAGLLAKGLLPGLVLSVDDVDAAFARLEAAGCDVIQEPTTQHWGRDCAFRDPAGNMVRLNQH